MSSKDIGFSKKVLYELSVFRFDVGKDCHVQPKNNQEQNFIDQILTVSFLFIGTVMSKIERNIRKLWNVVCIEAVILPKIILGTDMLVKISSVSTLELLAPLVGCSI